MHTSVRKSGTYFNNIRKQFTEDFVLDVECKTLGGQLSFLQGTHSNKHGIKTDLVNLCSCTFQEHF